jgi:hypothetical protein
MRTIIDMTAWIVGIIGMIIGIAGWMIARRTYRLSRSQFNFAVMISCIDRFQKIIAQLKYGNEQDREKALTQYIDLCNEELFYFQSRYLPDEVIIEWLEGMIQCLPLFNAKGDNVNPTCLPGIIEQGLLTNYPRIRKAFTVNELLDPKSDSQRQELTSLIKKNLCQKSS